jgi:hypothetical protein
MLNISYILVLCRGLKIFFVVLNDKEMNRRRIIM